MKNRIYLDYAATPPATQAEPCEALRAGTALIGNSSSIHQEGVKAKKMLEIARRKTAAFFGGRPEEIIFTSGGTESNNLAIFGAIGTGKHAITTVIEHSSVLECFRELEKRGVEVDYLPVNNEGILELKILEKALRPETALVSVGYANGEIGVIQPIGKISKLLLDSVIFHIDASQAPLYLNCEKETLGADLITVDGHKIYGPLGAGALFIRRGIKLKPLMFGGGQENGLRPGTENLPAIVGLADALESAKKNRGKESLRLTKLRDFFIAEIEKEIPNAILNGDRDKRLPNIINFSFSGKEAEFLALQLDAAGIAVATKSACLKNERESYVIKALGGDLNRATSSIRFSFGKDTKKSDLEYTVKVLRKLILRRNIDKEFCD
ncbi:MAG: cysteine desulfurase family protein [Candidatus Paceibacterota bacterium]|jgi:cysteine desulfurase